MEPLLIKNFLSEDEIQILYNASCNCDSAFSDSTDLQAAPRWKMRTAYIHNVEKYDSLAAATMLNATKRIQDIIREIETNDNIYVETPQFSRWLPGDELDPPHADNCEPDGSPNISPYRSHGAIIYLNEDFDGGQLFYPNFKLFIKPSRGMLAIHGADLKFMHGVKKVLHNRRHTIITFATMDLNIRQKMRHSYLNE